MCAQAIGLPSGTKEDLTQLLALAVNDGVLICCDPIPSAVKEMVPSAVRAWAWADQPLRVEVLASLLKADRERVVDAIAKLKSYAHDRDLRISTLLASLRFGRRLKVHADVVYVCP